ncbi:hypothetical protein COLO4_14473 [Corchorus olitorius]|uniref:Uncharacterized protein n=1 Tax=Corchorus olitorius TaxID=93759 RepID=A0A1R3JS18_9ROSI|nr:hypothetical protein COLO4_14473 [Corchorus olitorius]
MEDGVPEAETLLRPTSLSEDKVAIGETENPQGEESERPTGFINHFISNLVTGGGGDADEEKREKVPEPEGGKKEEQGGGILDHIISNLVTPSSPKTGKRSREEVESFDARTENEADEEGGGGGGDDAAPTTDEATILIHIVQD